MNAKLMQWKRNKICQCEIYFEEAYFEEVTIFEKNENKNFKNNPLYGSISSELQYLFTTLLLTHLDTYTNKFLCLNNYKCS